MSIYRIQKRKNPFVLIDKRAINNSSLSWKAKGLLTYLISKPDNWKVKFKDLEKRSSDGRSACRSGLKELEENGYISKQRIRNEKGVFTGFEYQVFEFPQTENKKSSFEANKAINRKPDYGDQKTCIEPDGAINRFFRCGKTIRGKSNTTNNNSNNNKRINNKITTTNPTDLNIPPDMEQVIKAWNNTFEVVVDKSNDELIDAISKATQVFEISDLLQAIKYRSQAKFYKEDYPHLRDNPKYFFRYPKTIKNDMNRRPFKLITYDKKCQLEQEGTAKKFEKCTTEKDNLGRPKWRVYG